MTITFSVCAVICAAYWAVLIFYAGPVSSQNYIWIIFAAFFACNAAAASVCRRDPKRIPLWLVTALHTLCVTAILIFAVTGVLIVSRMHPVEEPGLDYVVVLGAKIGEDGQPDGALKKRLDRAIDYASENRGTVFVLSGGKNGNEPIPEAQAMADYLVFNGIPANRLLLEIESGNTNENVICCRALIDRIIEENRLKLPAQPSVIRDSGPVLQAEDRPVRIGFLTSDFHLYRTLKIAEHQGMSGIYGLSSRSDPVLFLHLCFRECLAILKDKFMGNM